MVCMLAEEQTWQIVREGGPFVIAFCALVIGVATFWKLAGKPSLDALLTISANFAKAADRLDSSTNRLDHAVGRLEAHESEKR